MLSKFMNSRSDGLYDTFPATRIPYGQQDADELYAVFSKTEKEFQRISCCAGEPAGSFFTDRMHAKEDISYYRLQNGA